MLLWMIGAVHKKTSAKVLWHNEDETVMSFMSRVAAERAAKHLRGAYPEYDIFAFSVAKNEAKQDTKH